MPIFTPMKDTLLLIKQRLAPAFSDGEIKNITRIIFENLMGYSQVDIIMHDTDSLSDFMKEKINRVLDRLLLHEPVQYIFGEAYFQGLHLKVNSHTLIPRPETEQLVDFIVDENPLPDLRVLDIGTGSGAIAIALARALRFPVVHALDISEGALAVAAENADAHKVKVQFFLRDILAEPAPDAPCYDIIVSNPPYVTDSERADMEANVLDFEPHSALFVPDADPLLIYRAIAAYASEALVDGGRIYFEINRQFGRHTADLLLRYGFEDAVVIKDMYGNDRFVKAIKSARL